MRRAPTSALLIATTSLLAWPAMADITPEEVWADWKRLIESTDATFEVGSEDASGDTLTISDLAFKMEFPEDSGSVESTLAEIVFRDRGDGTVEVTTSPEYPVAVAGKDATTGEEFAMSMILNQSGFVTIASRDGDTTRYDYLGPEITATVASVLVDGQAVPFDLDVTLTGIKGGYAITEGTPRNFDGSFDAETFAMTGGGTDPEDPSATFNIDVSLTDFSQSGSGTVIGMMALADMSSMMAEGFTTEWAFSHGPAEYSISGSDDETKFNLNTTAASGSFDGVISPEGLTYGGGNTDLSVAISSTDIPFPQLTFNMAESEGRLTMPVTPGEDPSDFGLLMRMVDLEISDAIWGMFDPAGQLPRDPATLVVDLAGQARWLIDIFDPEVADAMGPGEMPGEVESLTLNALQLTVAGAELTGDGAFEFDNTPGGPFAPAPTPSGAINLMLTGGNGLLDTLVNMGLVPQEQAMGARMMLGLFARPGDGPDTLVSTIEVGSDGSVSANGQRIR